MEITFWIAQRFEILAHFYSRSTEVQLIYVKNSYTQKKLFRLDLQSSLT